MKKLLFTLISLFFVVTVYSTGVSPLVTITVSGKKAWTKTGINVSLGQKIDISSSGMVMPNGTVKSDPNGVPNRPVWQKNYSVIKTSNHVCLIGKIGENGIPFFVGKHSVIVASGSGELFLGINDTDLGNNSGEFIVNVITSAKNNFSLKELSISAKKSWAKTGVYFNNGGKMKIVASGTVMPNGKVKSGPNGVPNRPDWQKYYSIIKTSNHICLIGKIGENGKPFFVGEKLMTKVDETGELFLRVNDTDLGNNSGEFKVKIFTK